jgi:hypothetical protein
MTDTPLPQDPQKADNAAGAGCMTRIVRRSSVRGFRVTESVYFDKPIVTIIRTTTPARAKYLVWDSAHCAGYSIEFASLKVVRAPEYDAAKLIKDRCYAEDFAQSILPTNAKHIHPEPNTKDNANQ